MNSLKNLTTVQWIGIVLGINGVLNGFTPQFTALFGPTAVAYIQLLTGIGSGVMGVVVTVLTGQTAQIQNVLNMPGVEKISVNGQANAALATLAVDKNVNKIGPTPAAETTVAATAAKAAAMLVVFVLASLLFAPSAFAQTAPAPSSSASPSPVLSAVQAQIYSSLNVIIGFAGGIVVADLNAAIADAQAQVPPNAQAIACWTAIGKIPVTSIPTGAGAAYIKQKFLDLQSLYMPLNLNCGSVAPLFLKEYNQFMSLAASQNF